MSDNLALLGADYLAEPIAEVLHTITSTLARTRAVKRLDEDTLRQQAHDQLDAAVTAAKDAGPGVGRDRRGRRGGTGQRPPALPPGPQPRRTRQRGDRRHSGAAAPGINAVPPPDTHCVDGGAR
jgi:hypothetical protein